jgi:hypothetical protein
MKQSFSFLLALALGLAVAAGCSSEQPGPGDSNSRIRTESGFCTEWARVVCSANVVSACDFEDVDACREWELQYCLDLVPPGYQSSRYAQECLNAAKTAFSDANLTASEASEVLNLGGDCSRLVDGETDEGDPCSSDFDCNMVEENRCVIKPGFIEGTCQIPEDVGGGERCDDPAAVCEEGFYCDGRNCIAVLVDDEVCTNDAECGSAALCVLGGDASGLCTPKHEAREACTTDQECLSGFCVNDTCRLDVDLSLDVPFCIEQ